MKQKLDGREATLQVKQYFEEVHGSYGVTQFTVRNVIHNDNESKWIITCSFYRTISAVAPSYYQVELQDNGVIITVKETEGAR